MKKSYITSVILSILGSFMLISCDNSQENQNSKKLNDLSIIASYDSGQLNIKDLEQSILDLPISQRWTQTDHNNWLKNHIKKHILHKKLIDEAVLIGAQEEPKYKNLIHNLSRNAYTQQYLSNTNLNNGITDEQIKKYYEENIEKYVFKEKRLVRHIFINKKVNAQELLNSIRDRYLIGESFNLLAEQYSESETRHNRGSLGFVERGDKSADFDSVIFELEKNKPSEIVRTADGYHLFMVDDILPAKSYAIEEVKNNIYGILNAEMGIDFLKNIALSHDVPNPFIIVTQEQLNQMNLNSKLRDPVLTVGEYLLPYNQMMYELNELNKTNKIVIDKTSQMQYIKTVAYSEVIYQHMKNNDIEHIKSDRLLQQKNKLLVEEYIKMRIASYLNNNPELIKEYFEKNRIRFTTPAKLNLQRLMIPKKNSENLMPVLESSIDPLDNGQVVFDKFAEQYEGKIQNLGWKNTHQLAIIDKQILKYAFLLKVNEYSPPFTNAKFYTILKLIDKKEPVIQELSQVRQQVMKDYMANNSALIFSKISLELLKDVKINDSLVSDFLSYKSKVLE